MTAITSVLLLCKLEDGGDYSDYEDGSSSCELNPSEAFVEDEEV